jgi:hypothetical protein
VGVFGQPQQQQQARGGGGRSSQHQQQQQQQWHHPYSPTAAATSPGGRRRVAAARGNLGGVGGGSSAGGWGDDLTGWAAAAEPEWAGPESPRQSGFAPQPGFISSIQPLGAGGDTGSMSFRRSASARSLSGVGAPVSPKSGGAGGGSPPASAAAASASISDPIRALAAAMSGGGGGGAAASGGGMGGGRNNVVGGRGAQAASGGGLTHPTASPLHLHGSGVALQMHPSPLQPLPLQQQQPVSQSGAGRRNSTVAGQQQQQQQPRGAPQTPPLVYPQQQQQLQLQQLQPSSAWATEREGAASSRSGGLQPGTMQHSRAMVMATAAVSGMVPASGSGGLGVSRLMSIASGGQAAARGSLYGSSTPLLTPLSSPGRGVRLFGLPTPATQETKEG